MKAPFTLVRSGALLVAAGFLSSCASQSTFKDEGSYTIGAPPEKDQGRVHGSVGMGAAFGSDGYSSQWTGGELYYTKGNMTVGGGLVHETEL
jgi:hypothetical protein